VAVHSVFHDVKVRADGYCPRPPAPLKVQIEFVGEDPDDHPKEVYFVIDGRRMAQRWGGKWVSLVRGFEAPTDE
jgi:hypothetical protein